MGRSLEKRFTVNLGVIIPVVAANDRSDEDTL